MLLWKPDLSFLLWNWKSRCFWFCFNALGRFKFCIFHDLNIVPTKCVFCVAVLFTYANNIKDLFAISRWSGTKTLCFWIPPTIATCKLMVTNMFSNWKMWEKQILETILAWLITVWADKEDQLKYLVSFSYFYKQTELAKAKK